MTNPEAAAPTDMEAARELAAHVLTPGTAFNEWWRNLARCLLASSAEVAALREQVARLQARKPDADIAAKYIRQSEATIRADERARVERDTESARIERGDFGPDFRCEWNGASWSLSRKVGLGRSASTIAPTLGEAVAAYAKADPGALPKSGAAGLGTAALGVVCEALSSSGIAAAAHEVVAAFGDERHILAIVECTFDDGVERYVAAADLHDDGGEPRMLPLSAAVHILQNIGDERWAVENREPRQSGAADGEVPSDADPMLTEAHTMSINGVQHSFTREGWRLAVGDIARMLGWEVEIGMANRAAAPSSELVERDPDDDSAWPLPEPWMRWKRHDEGDWFVHVAGLDHNHAGECAFIPHAGGDGWPGSLGYAYPSLLPIIEARTRAARAKAAAPKDPGGSD